MEFENPRLFLLLVPAAALFVLVEWRAERLGGAVLRTALRLLAIGAVLCGLAGPRRGLVALEGEAAPIVPLVDVSDSIGAAAEGRALALARDAVRRLPPDSVLEPIVFAGAARPAPGGDSLDPIERAKLAPERSRLTGAVHAAAAAIGARRGARLLLFSDGLVEDADAAAELANELSLPIDAADPGGAARPDARAVSLRLPDRVEESVPADVALLATANVAADAVARLTIDDRLVAERRLRLEPGVRSSAVFPNVAFERGTRTVIASVAIPGDDEPRNDEIRAAVQATEPPRYLLVSKPGFVSPVESALRAQGLALDRWDSLAPLRGKGALAPYAAVILGDVPDGVPMRAEDAAILAEEVERRGLGLLAIASPLVEESLREGAALARLSPVTLAAKPPEEKPEEKPPPPPEEKKDEPPPPEEKPDPKPKTERPKPKKEKVVGSTLTLLLLIDKSGSMRYGDSLALAKATAESTAAALDPSDVVGVMAFDDKPRWIVPFVAAGDAAEIRRGLGKLSAGGRTFFFPALAAAREALRATQSRIKHLVFITDGQPEDSFENYRALATAMAAEAITISVVGVGEALGNTAFLGDVAKWGGGKSYIHASFSEVPQLVLIETKRVLSQADSIRTLEDGDEPPEEVAANEATDPKAADATASPDRFEVTGSSESEKGEPSAADAAAAEKPPEKRALPEPPPVPVRDYPVVARGPVPFLAGIDAALLPPVRGFVRCAEKAASWVPIAVAGEGPLFALRVAGAGSVLLLATRETEDGAGRWLEFPPLGKILAQALRLLSRGAAAGGSGSPGLVAGAGGAELIEIGPDRAALERLARATGGDLVDPERVEPRRLAPESRPDSVDPAPFFLAAALLLPVEFLLRRRAAALRSASSQLPPNARLAA